MVDERHHPLTRMPATESSTGNTYVGTSLRFRPANIVAASPANPPEPPPPTHVNPSVWNRCLALIALLSMMLWACGSSGGEAEIFDAAKHQEADEASEIQDSAEAELPGPPGCNGHAEFCPRRFDEVAYVTTHNAMANKADGFIGPNQNEDIPTQLADGVRGLMLDIHVDEGEVVLCHGYCSLGRVLLVDGLGQIRDFLEANPREVVTILFETYVSNDDTGAAFVEAGLEDMLHAQIAGEPWPALEEMIDSGRRLVVFTDHQSETYPWLHRTWDHCFDTDWAAETLDDFSCDRLRGSADNPLFILNHFLTAPIAFPHLAEQANANPGFIERAQDCMAVHDTIPNFVTVDFYSIGDVFDVVDSLNGI